MKYRGLTLLFVICLVSTILIINGNKIHDDEKKHFSYSLDKSLYGQLDKIKAGFTFTTPVYGGIVSHHLLASIDIAKFYASFVNQEIDTVILIGPNHEGQGTEKIAVSSLEFKTPWDNTDPDTDLINKLVSTGAVKIDENAFIGEHSISVEVPYIRYYLPKVKLVPIVITRNASRSDLILLADSLIKINDKKIVVIASVDFSHHTNKQIAEINDTNSIQAITDFNLEELYDLNIDSPNTIYVLLTYLFSKNANKISYWQQNAANILNSPDYEDVTSYLFAFFEKK